MADAHEIVARVNRVPVLSTSAHRLMAIMSKEDHTVDDVRQVVDAEPTLAANVLRVANSAALGRRKPAASTVEAVSYLGDKIILGIALGSCAHEVYNDPLEGYYAEAGDLWRHSLRVAIAARQIVPLAKIKISADIAYTAGLLHDIGKPIISTFIKDKLPQLSEKVEEAQQSNFLSLEHEYLGTDHTEVGALLAQRWQLPKDLTAAVRYHHTPHLLNDPLLKTLAVVVHLGDMIAMMGGTGTGKDTLHYPLDSAYTDCVTITNELLEKTVFYVGLEYEKTSQALTQATGQK